MNNIKIDLLEEKYNRNIKNQLSKTILYNNKNSDNTLLKNTKKYKNDIYEEQYNSESYDELI